MSSLPNMFLIEDAAQIRALESPMRQELVDALTTLGPSSISDLAAYLGRHADSLYFHMRKLVKVKLVVVNEQRKVGRHEFAIYAVPGKQARLVYRPAVLRSVRKVVAGAVRLSVREFQRAILQPNEVMQGPARALWGGRVKGWMTIEQLAEVNRLLEQVFQILNQDGPGPDRRVYSLGWVLTPAQVKVRKTTQKTGITQKPSRSKS
jgi:DNA-binding transcriptional ArsR family regulator